MHPLILIPAYLAVTVTPLVLSAIQGLPPRPVSDEIASGLAMVAFAIVLVEFVLSGRFRSISARMGMDVTMRFHQVVARAALAFALLHPFLYRTPFNAPLPWDTTGQLTLGLDAGSLITGVIAWVAFPVFVVLSIFRARLPMPYRYENWRLMHGLGAVLIAALVTHHGLSAGRYSADPLLAGFWIVMLAVAVGSVVYTHVFRPFGAARRPYTVVSVRKIALKTWELSIRPMTGVALDFQAGQFVWLNLGHSPFTLLENPFSISSAPAQRPVLQFVIKQAGDFTGRIGEVAVGTRAYVDGA